MRPFLYFFVEAPNSQEAKRGEERRTARMIRQRAMTRAEIARPMVSIASIELPGPEERNPFMKERLGIKK